MLVLKRIPHEERAYAARRICVEVAMEAGNDPHEMLGILEAAKLELWQIGMEIEAEAESEEDD